MMVESEDEECWTGVKTVVGFFEVKGNRKVFCIKECSKEYFSHRGHKPRKNGGK